MNIYFYFASTVCIYDKVFVTHCVLYRPWLLLSLFHSSDWAAMIIWGHFFDFSIKTKLLPLSDEVDPMRGSNMYFFKMKEQELSPNYS